MAITITSQPKTATVVQPAGASFTVAFTPKTATVQWQWAAKGSTTFSNITTGGGNGAGWTTPTYSKSATVLAMDGDQFRAVISASGETSVTSNVVVIHVLATAPAECRSMRVAKGGSWVEGVPYVAKGGAWIKGAAAYVAKGGAWVAADCGSGTPPGGGGGGGAPLTDDAADFLAADSFHVHTNSGHTIRYENQPADKVFPDGQKVYVGGYQTDDNLLQKAADSGFTVTGYQGVYRDHSGAMAKATAAGLMYAPLIREISGPGGGDAYHFGCYINGTKTTGTCMGKQPSCAGVPVLGKSVVHGNATTAMNNWMALNDDNIYGWLYCLDDCSAKNDLTLTSDLYKAMRDNDPKKRTIGDFGGYDAYIKPGADNPASSPLKNITCTIMQNYYHGGSYTGDGDGVYKSRAIIGNWSEELLKNSNAVPSNNGKPRLIAQGWIVGFAWNVVPEMNSDPQVFREQYLHDSLLSLMKGANGLHWYIMSKNSGSGAYSDRTLYCCQAEKTLRFNQIFWAMKLINKDSDVAKALVWGRRTGHTLPITVTGTNTFKYGRYGQTHPQYGTRTENMINHVDILFEGKRYIIITNSTPRKEVVDWWKANPNGSVKGSTPSPAVAAGCNTCRGTFSTTTQSYERWGGASAPSKYNVPVTISGFVNDLSKKQVVVRELVSGNVENPDANGKIQKTMAPLESLIFVVEPATGWTN